MSKYKPTIGLEIHAELKTLTKMFCNSKNDVEEKEPNVNVCPVCMGHPGTLPVINKEAVKHVLKVGVAVGGELADFAEFDRKNYFYPDIPKGYQISQYAHPLVKGGMLNGVAITRVHLEEDTARSIHDKKGYSLVDFNRAGVPLMELVTEPVIKSAKEAGDFARELQLLLRYLGVSDADMEKGHMRVEANVSVSKSGERGVKTEVKNLNSFRNAERAIEYEVARQIEVLESGGEVVQETRGWDESAQETVSQRTKEYSEDYRYFPDPDLPKLKISEIKEFSKSELKKELPELPWEKKERYEKDYGLKTEDAVMFVSNMMLGEFFERVSAILGGEKSKVKTASNYIASDVAGMLKNLEEGSLPSPENFAELIDMVASGNISSRGAKDILAVLFKENVSPIGIAEREGLMQKSDEGEIEDIVKKVIAENEDVVSDYKGGKESALKFLVGAGMRMSGGSANPKVLEDVFKRLLS